MASLLALVALILLIQSPPGVAWVAERIEALVADTIGLDLRLGALHLDLLHLSAEATDLWLGLRDPGGTVELAAADRVLIDLGAGSLWSGALHIEELLIDTPRVSLRRGADGRWRLPAAAGNEIAAEKGAPGVSLPRVRIDALRLEGGGLRLEDAHTPIDLDAGDVDLKLGVDPAVGDHRFDLQIGSFQLTSGSRVVPGENLRIAGRVGPERVAFQVLRVHTAAADLSGSGKMEFETSYPVGFRIAVEGRPSELAALLGGPLPLAVGGGPLTLEATVSGPLLAPHIEGRLAAADLDLGGERLEIAADFRAATSGIDLPELRLSGALGSVVGSWRWRPQAGDIGTTSFRVDLSGLDLASLQRLIAPDAPPVAARLTGHIEGTTAGNDVSGVVASAAVRVEPSARDRAGALAPEGELIARLSGGRIELDVPSLDVGPARVAGTLDGTIAPVPRGKADLRLSSADLARLRRLVRLWSEALGFSLPPVPALEGGVDMTFRGRIEGDGLDGELHLVGWDLAIAGRALGRLRADLRLAPGTVDIDGTVEGELGGAAATVALDLRQEVPIVRRARLKVDRLEPSRLSLALPVQLDGTIRGLVEGTGPLNRLDLTAHVEGAQIAVDGVEVADLALTAHMAAGRLEIEELAARIAGGNVLVSGSIDPGADQLDLILRLREVSVEPLARRYLGSAEMAGRLHVELDLQGRATAPELWGHVRMTEGRFGPDRLAVPVIEALFQGRYRAPLLVLDALDVTVPGAWLSAGGGIDLEGRGTGPALWARGAVDLAAAAPLLALLDPAGELGLEGSTGRLTLDLEGRGELSDPLAGLKGVLRLDGVRTGVARLAQPLLLQRAVIRLAGDEIELEELDMALGAARLTGRSTVPLALLVPGESRPSAEGRRGELDLRLVGFQPSDALGREAGVSGRIDAVLAASFDELSLGGLDARLTLERLDIGLVGLEVASTEAVHVQLHRGLVQLEPATLAGEGIALSMGGLVRLDGARTDAFDLAVQGELNMTRLAGLAEGLGLGGDLSVDVHLGGPLGAPEPTGRLVLARGLVAYRAAGIDLRNVEGALRFERDTLHLERVEGTLGSGRVSVEGRAHLAGWELARAAGTLRLTGATLRSAGARLALDGVLNLDYAAARGETLLRGNVDLLRGAYTEPFDLDVAMVRSLLAPAPLAPSDETTLLESIRLDLVTGLDGGMRIRNNLGDMVLRGNLRWTGSPAAPRVSGRVELDPNSEIDFSGRRYEVVRGRIDLTDNEPRFDLELRTQVPLHDVLTAGDIDDQLVMVFVSVSGTMEDLRTDVTAPGITLDKAKLTSVLLFGRQAAPSSGRELGLVAGSMAAYFAGQLTAKIERQVADAVGLDLVRIEPILVANDTTGNTDAGARLTVGKRLSRWVRATYSVALNNSQDQTWGLDLRLGRRGSVRITRDDSDTYAAALRYARSFDLAGALAGRPFSRDVIEGIRDIRVVDLRHEGTWPLSDRARRRAVPIQPGQRVSPFELQDGVDRLEAALRSAGYLEALVTFDQEGAADGAGRPGIVATYRVEPGPKIRFSYESPSYRLRRRLKRELADLWAPGFDDRTRQDALRRALEGRLAREGYLEPTVDVEVENPEPGLKLVRIGIDPGPHFAKGRIAFEGLRALDGRSLRADLAAAAGVTPAVLPYVMAHEPDRFARRIEAVYAELGLFEAQVGRPRRQGTPASWQVVVPITEGPVAPVALVALCGLDDDEAASWRERLELRPGQAYRPRAFLEGRSTLLGTLRGRGYVDARVEGRILRGRVDTPCGSEQDPMEKTGQRSDDSEEHAVTVVYRIDKGPRATIAEIEVRGLERTPERFVRRKLSFAPGDPLDAATLAASESALRAMSLFDAVYIRSDVVSTDSTKRRVIVHVTERAPQRASIGGRYDSKGIFQSELRLQGMNIWGTGVFADLYSLYGSRRKDLRLSLNLPPVHWNATTTLLTQTSDATTGDVRERFRSLTLQQQRLLQRRTELLVGLSYRISRVTTPDAISGLPFDIEFQTTRVTASLLRDQRNDVFNATRGWFGSLALEVSSEALGSDFPFVKGFLQTSLYRPVGPGLVLAAAARLGAARASHGQILIGSERFRAGGGTSVRGFDFDSLGPRSRFTGKPTGGEAMAVFNLELRFPLFSFLRGAAFIDAGQVYEDYRRLFSGDLRRGAGLGLRAETPFGLVRLDVGWKVDREPDESAYEWFVGLGQMF